ncbi:unnamed protein product [Ranitomeya imitator]|uniref:Uncharacterized protein n=1 Tax=Ranitomeya imitator TaxID=111125 RepID=A0ABN9KRC5_9NEOB|nr:unnamed protein product [Ranitomeya imitator]
MEDEQRQRWNFDFRNERPAGRRPELGGGGARHTPLLPAGTAHPREEETRRADGGEQDGGTPDIHCKNIPQNGDWRTCGGRLDPRHLRKPRRRADPAPRAMGTWLTFFQCRLISAHLARGLCHWWENPAKH